MANDNKDYFTITTPGRRNGVKILGCYNHMSGNLELVPDYEDRGGTDAGDAARAFCDEHEGNYFYLSDVRVAFRKAGVDPLEIP